MAVASALRARYGEVPHGWEAWEESDEEGDEDYGEEEELEELEAAALVVVGMDYGTPTGNDYNGESRPPSPSIPPPHLAHPL